MTAMGPLPLLACEIAECSGDHPVVIYLSPTWRIIASPQADQWILQRRAGLRHGRVRWDSRSYCRGREALIRVCRTFLGVLSPQQLDGLIALPDRIGCLPIEFMPTDEREAKKTALRY